MIIIISITPDVLILTSIGAKPFSSLKDQVLFAASSKPVWVEQ